MSQSLKQKGSVAISVVGAVVALVGLGVGFYSTFIVPIQQKVEAVQDEQNTEYVQVTNRLTSLETKMDLLLQKQGIKVTTIK